MNRAPAPRRRLFGRILLIGLLLATAAAAGGFLALRAWVIPQLPSVESLHDIKLGVPLKVYTRDGKLIGEFGAERREPLTYAQLPKPLVQAFLAAEDDRFFEHSGVDVAGLARAAVVLATTGQKRQGGSTITMQLARNVYLTNERSFARKIKEIFLAHDNRYLQLHQPMGDWSSSLDDDWIWWLNPTTDVILERMPDASWHHWNALPRQYQQRRFIRSNSSPTGPSSSCSRVSVRVTGRTLRLLDSGPAPAPARAPPRQAHACR